MKRKIRFISIFICVALFLVVGCSSTPKNGNGKVRVKATEEGIEVKFPKLSSANYIEVIRFNDKNEQDGNRISTYDTSTSKLIDYFVEKDKSYYYSVVYKDDSFNEIYKVSSEKVKAIGGKGELKFGSSPKAKYDSSTGLLVFEQLPSLTSDIERFVCKQSVLYNFYYRYFPDGGYHGRVGCGANFFVHSDGKTVSNSFVNDGYDVEGKPMVLIDISGFEFNINNATYIKYMSSEEMMGMPNPIPFHNINK